MSLLDTILQATGGQDKLAQQFGLDNNQVSAALSQLVPALNQGVKKNAGAPGGLEALLGAISGGNQKADAAAEEQADCEKCQSCQGCPALNLRAFTLPEPSGKQAQHAP